MFECFYPIKSFFLFFFSWLFYFDLLDDLDCITVSYRKQVLYIYLFFFFAFITDNHRSVCFSFYFMPVAVASRAASRSNLAGFFTC